LQVAPKPEKVFCNYSASSLPNTSGRRALRTSGQGQTGDVAAINEEVDYTRLRRSFTEQIIGAYLRVTGRASQFGALGPLATAVGASIVDPWVSQIVNPENLAQLLRGGTVSSELGPVSFRLEDLPSTLNLAWDAWLSSEYWINRFSIWLPPGGSQANQFRVAAFTVHWKVTASICLRSCVIRLRGNW
jgi:Protein of unknown function (DUF2939)